ncbi:hypothetical protein Tco_0336518 [Tanacetum coccineum]
MEAIQDIFVHNAATQSFTCVFRMDVKTSFLHGTPQRRCDCVNLKVFIDADHPSHVYKFKEALMGTKPTVLKHHKEVKGSIRYLLGNRSLTVLWYSKKISGIGTNRILPMLDYAGCKDTFKILLVELNS